MKLILRRPVTLSRLTIAAGKPSISFAASLKKREEVEDSARFLLSCQQDEQWETIIAGTSTRPRLDAFLSESAAEGDEPLDEFDKLFG